MIEYKSNGFRLRRCRKISSLYFLVWFTNLKISVIISFWWNIFTLAQAVSCPRRALDYYEFEFWKNDWRIRSNRYEEMKIWTNGHVKILFFIILGLLGILRKDQYPSPFFERFSPGREVLFEPLNTETKLSVIEKNTQPSFNFWWFFWRFRSVTNPNQRRNIRPKRSILGKQQELFKRMEILPPLSRETWCFTNLE